jgi:hypothetical protein
LGWLVLVALLLVGVPVFLRMPMTGDVSFYDTCARHVLSGGALERDLLFLPPPGMAWSLALVRATLGGSSEALRLADLAVFTGIVWLLVRWLRVAGLSRGARVWTAALMYAFYLTAMELLHCQPDTWMLLLALAALHLRRRRLRALAEPGRSVRRDSLASFLEGMCWAAGCLFKPFVAVPALLTWLASAGLARRSGGRRGAWLVWDACCVLAGGLLVGAAWQGWLLASGTWSDYWQNFRDFGGEYYSDAAGVPQRCLGLLVKLSPWGLLHLAAVPVALVALARLLRQRSPAQPRPTDGDLCTPLLAAFYVAWLAQASFLQFQVPYHLVPVALLAMALVVCGLRTAANPWPGRVTLFAIGFCGVIWQPAVGLERLSLWGRCWTGGDGPELRDRLSLDPRTAEWVPDWQDLEEVAEFLRSQQVGDGDLTCYHTSAIHLYPQLGVKPATRFLNPSWQKIKFPQRGQRIDDELRASGQRYIVTDVKEEKLSQAQAVAQRPGQPLALPPDFPPEKAEAYPFSEPVVFRAGRYYVHQARQEPVGRD